MKYEIKNIEINIKLHQPKEGWHRINNLDTECFDITAKLQINEEEMIVNDAVELKYGESFSKIFEFTNEIFNNALLKIYGKTQNKSEKVLSHS